MQVQAKRISFFINGEQIWQRDLVARARQEGGLVRFASEAAKFLRERRGIPVQSRATEFSSIAV